MLKTVSTGIFFLLATMCTVSFADIYKYVDESGVTYYTNAPESTGSKRVLPEKKDNAKPSDYNEIIESKSSKYRIEPSLVKAVIAVESNWNYNAVSKKGALGLMQLMPSTARDMAVSNPLDPEENIEGGVRYLRFLLDRFNEDLPLALAAYNAGFRTVENQGGIPAITETEQYVEKVLSIYKGHAAIARPAQIYKVTLDDGTVLFTNTPFAYQNFKLSKF
ncbi:MAG: DUF4124 domain-containing protein [Nitrospiraceae bacterium]|nr:MAG: DUF4124 domain-containing protein [Nitrospiraceae bacterium]